ncbi:MAG: polyphosphate polymerase domain-containing protein [Candidatus Riflebacteria bacterium]|nr:polyphosphate polymerase domain-containing protein [Candidatus Riflebacteria bacterium]
MHNSGNQSLLAENKLSPILSEFETVTLDEMKSVALMKRSDIKYVMNVSMLTEVLENLTKYYKVLEIKDKRENNYQTLYFDTSDLEMYRSHHNGVMNRYKVRIREYMDSAESFMEVKFKNNKGVTQKNRIKVPAIRAYFDNDAEKFISEISKFRAEDLQPVLWNRYTRITLVSKTSIERVTIDLNLEFANSNQDKVVDLQGIVIAEVKKDGLVHKSDFVRLMSEKSVREEGFSKYCIGVSVLYNNVKKNNFKEKVLLVNKLAGRIC